MNNLLKNKLFIACILLGLLAALYINYQRHQIEVASHTVELVMDYEEIVDLAATEGADVTGLMRQFREAGIVSLAVYDMTLEKLNKSGKIFTLSGAELLQRYQTGVPADPAIAELLKAGSITADRVYVFGPASLTFQEVQEDLIRRLGPERVTSVRQGTTHVLEVKGNYEKLIKWNLGLSTEEMTAVAQNGFCVVPRPTNYAQVTAEDVDAVFARIEKQDKTSTMFFVGEEVLGYKGQMERTADYLNRDNIVLGLIEHPLQIRFVKQEGLEQLAQAVNYRTARVYVIPKEEQPKLKIQEAVNERWILSARERNIRINLMRTYTKPEGDKTLTQTNLTYVEKTKRGLEEAGFSIGRADTFNTYYPPRAALACIILAACAAGVMLLAELAALSNVLRWALLLGTFIPLAAVVLLGHGNVARQAAALASAISFPSLAMGWQIKKWSHVKPGQYSLGQILWHGIKAVAQVSLFSVMGGLFIAALLGDVRYLLEIEIYRGVKLTFVAPLLIVTYIFFRHINIWEESSEKTAGVCGQIQRLLDQPVLLKYLGGLALAVLVAIVYVGRSGHTAGIPVPAFEVKMRALLEQLFYARPRTREFLIGHPTFMIAAYAIYRGGPKIWQLVLVVFASMAQSSLVETFAHLRTPVMMSLVRGIDGWVVGVILGIVAVVILHWVLKVAVHRGRRTVGHG